ncbi:MAG: tetratricopeptide repeat protein, partial [Pseudomonadota bacterium]
AGKPTIHFDHHAQVGQIGDHNTQHNNVQIIHQGDINIDLAKQLGITETALKNFFKILEHQNVPAAELDNALRKLAARHKELEERVKQLDSEDPEVIALQKQAREAIINAQYEQAEDLLDKAIELDNSAAEKVNAVYLKRKRSAAENMALKAETLHTRFAWDDAIKAYQQAISFAGEARAEERMAEYQNSLGRVCHDNGQYTEAVIYFELALANDYKTYGENHPTVAIRRNNLGAAWIALVSMTKRLGIMSRP